MAAPLGFKTFTTGEVLTAADTNGYLMQGVLVFADAAARTAAITSPQEGQTSYLKDTDEIQVYSGSAWVTKSGSLPSQTGNAGKYLTTDGTTASWGTVTSGGMTLLSTTNLSGTSTVVSGISQAYTSLQVIVNNAYVNVANPLLIKLGTSVQLSGVISGTAVSKTTITTDPNNLPTATGVSSHRLNIDQYANTSFAKGLYFSGAMTAGSSSTFLGGSNTSATAVSSIEVTTVAGTATFSGGQILIYGVK